jgi:hypothetical protein
MFLKLSLKNKKILSVVCSPSAIEETGAMGGEIESRQFIGWWLF